MAKENLIILHGQVMSAPQVYQTPKGETVKGQFALNVIRRPMMTGGKVDDSPIFACPVITSKNKELADAIGKLRVGDMCDVRGVISTAEVIKTTKCPHCGNKTQEEGNLIYITPIYICKREDGLSQEEGIALLKKRAEVSNLCMIIGTLCRDVAHYKDEKKRSYAQYQLAVNRKYRIKEDPDTIKTDYPWVKVYGKQAIKDTECLKTGSVVYINGALQTRRFNKPVECEACHTKYTRAEDMIEIVPYSTEYLANYLTPEKEEKSLGDSNE